MKPGDKVTVTSAPREGQTRSEVITGYIKSLERPPEHLHFGSRAADFYRSTEPTTVEVAMEYFVVNHNNNEENAMESKYQFTVIKDRMSKTAFVYCRLSEDAENGNEQYRTMSGEVLERHEGGEMPLFATFPDEQFIPMIKAGREEYGS